MIIYYSIFAYTCIVAFIGCTIKFQKNKKAIYYLGNQEEIKMQKSISLFFALVSVALLVFFVGMRTRYADTAAYIYLFNNAPSGLSDIKGILISDYKDKGFYLIMVLFRWAISKDYTIWFFFLSIFQTGAIVKIYYKYSCNFFMSIYLFIASTTFTWMMNGTRQFFAVCFVLYFFEYLVDKKAIRFLIIVFLACTIHASAVIWIPAYFFAHFKPWSKQILLFISITILAFFAINKLTGLLDDAFTGTNYDGFASSLLNYGDGTDDGVNIIRVAVNAVPVILALIRKNYVEQLNNKVINLCINLSLMGVSVYFLGVVTSGIIVGRIPIYFTVFNFLLLPWLLNKTFNGSTRTLLKFACYVLYFAYFYYVMVIQQSGLYESSILGLYYY